MTDSRIGTDTIVLAFDFKGKGTQVKGTLTVHYRRYDQGWLLESVDNVNITKKEPK